MLINEAINGYFEEDSNISTDEDDDEYLNMDEDLDQEDLITFEASITPTMQAELDRFLLPAIRRIFKEFEKSTCKKCNYD